MIHAHCTPHPARVTNDQNPFFTFTRFRLPCGPYREYLLEASECPLCSWLCAGTHTAVVIAERSHVCACAPQH